MRALIVDDELMARTLLRHMLKDHSPEVEVIGECQDLPEAVKAIKKLLPDVVFLDIEMPGYSGLELFDFFSEEELNFKIIFTTAYNQYATQAFRLAAVDYILKPIASAHLIEAINKAKEKIEFDVLRINHLKHLLSGSPVRKIAVPQMKEVKFVDHDKILFLKGDGAYTEIHSLDQSVIIASRNLKHFEEVLSNADQFYRCHKSYIVNLDKVKTFQRSEGNYLILENDLAINVSNEKSDKLLEKMKR